MPDHPQDLEPALRDQRAAGLDPSLLNRLEAAADGSLLELTRLEIQFEAELRGIKPSTLPESMIDSLEQAASAVPYPTASTVVPFERQSARQPERSRHWWGAAAAVAILGALAALMLPGHTGNPPSPVAAQHSSPPADPTTSPRPHHQSTDIVPASYSRTLQETSDQGIYWPSNGAPHRVLKVVYKQQVTVEREDGSTYQFEQPLEEYYLVPTESN